jgi:ribosome-binding factor A
MERIGNVVRNVVAQAIQARLTDPRIPPITSVTRVEVSDDLSVAKVYVSVMAPEARRQLAVDALQHAAGLIRRMLAPELRIRKLPMLVFKLDESVRRGLDTLAVIEGAMRELGEVPEWERADAQAAAQDAQESGAPDPAETAPPDSPQQIGDQAMPCAGRRSQEDA